MPKCMKPMSNRNKIICGWESCISSMLLQSDLNKCRLSKSSKIDKLYINSASTRILQISKIDLIEYKNQIFPNNLHMHLIGGEGCEGGGTFLGGILRR